MKAASPYLTADEAAEFLRFSSTKAFHHWRSRHPRRIKAYRRGRVLLFKQHELEAALETSGGPVPVRRVS